MRAAEMMPLGNDDDSNQTPSSLPPGLRGCPGTMLSMIGSTPEPLTQWVPEDPASDNRPTVFFDPAFMAAYTRFSSSDSFCSASP